MRRERTEDSGERSVVLSSAEPFHGHDVKIMVGSAKGSVKSRECRQGKRKTCLQCFLGRRVFRGSAVVHQNVLRGVTLTAWDVLSHRFLTEN